MTRHEENMMRLQRILRILDVITGVCVGTMLTILFYTIIGA